MSWHYGGHEEMGSFRPKLEKVTWPAKTSTVSMTTCDVCYDCPDVEWFINWLLEWILNTCQLITDYNYDFLKFDYTCDGLNDYQLNEYDPV